MAYDARIRFSNADTQMTDERLLEGGSFPQEGEAPTASEPAGERADDPGSAPAGSEATSGAPVVAPNSLDRIKAALDAVRALLSPHPNAPPPTPFCTCSAATCCGWWK